MLVLSRKRFETVVIDGSITIKVLSTKGGTVRIGIDCPKEIAVRRGELEAVPEKEEPATTANGAA